MQVRTDGRGKLYQESPYGHGYNLSIPIPRHPPLEPKDVKKLASGDRVIVLFACDGPYECIVQRTRGDICVGTPGRDGRLACEVSLKRTKCGASSKNMKVWRKSVSNIEGNDDLLMLLKRYSYKRGSFTLASGKKSDFYIDCKQTFLRREGLWRAAQELNRKVRRFNPVAVAGEGVGGTPLAVAVSMISGFLSEKTIEPIIVRKKTKDHGTVQKVEYAKDLITEGARVVLVEDVLTTGGSASSAISALKLNGFDVVAVVALVDRLEGARELLSQMKVHVQALYNRADFVQ